jgi:hypothetical protein
MIAGFILFGCPFLYEAKESPMFARRTVTLTGFTLALGDRGVVRFALRQEFLASGFAFDKRFACPNYCVYPACLEGVGGGVDGGDLAGYEQLPGDCGWGKAGVLVGLFGGHGFCPFGVYLVS